MPSSQSWDEYGNIVINGRMAMKAALSVVICRQGAKAKCEKPGLVLCYETHYLFDDGEIDRKDEFFKYVSEICAGDSGFVVTTENEDVIRIDTRFGNTYRVKLKTNDNCIIFLDQQKPNNTGLGPEYVQNWNLVPKAENKELIKMFWKEIHVQPKLDEIYNGHEVVKCYMKWENMGTACVAPDIMGHKHECQVSAVLGYDNYTKIWMSNDTSTGMSEVKKEFL
uniref:Uncharacterized protein n=1 Tax=Ditylenchus dipsaci TaxID=166011 RepID=A0A915DMG4_9BILA